MPNPNAANRKDIRAAEKAARLATVQRQEILTSLMSSIAGRAWVWDLLTQCQCFATTFIPGAPDTSAFTEGRRSVGLAILGDIMLACPDHYITAAREANVRDAASERRNSENGNGRDQGPESGGSGAEGTLDDYNPYRDEDPGNEVQH